MVFVPESVNPLNLPSVALEEHCRLPSICAIYFAVDSQGVVQYIGRTENLKQRWVSHHRYQYLKLCDGVRISYLSIDDVALLPEIEAALIRYFDPAINRMGSNWSTSSSKPRGIKVRRIIKQEVNVPDLGDRIKQARESDSRSVTQLAASAGISRNYWYQLEAESVLGGIAEETLRKIEQVLGVDFGVRFEE